MAKEMNANAYQPDRLDRQILNILLENARSTHRDIAKKVGCSLGTVNTRIKKLEKEGIIQGYSVHVDYERLGYNIEVMIHIKIRRGEFYELSKKLINDPHVYLIFDMTGDYDAEVLARFRNRRELDEFVKKLQQYESIASTSTKMILNILREKFIA